MGNPLDYYEKNAEELFRRYHAVDPEELHCNWAHLLPEVHFRALDIGCGAGRDAFFFICRGSDVTAVDPCRALLDLAEERYDVYDVRWVEDGLPELTKVRALDERFDVILANAVWMHLAPEDRACALATVRDLLAEGGRFIVNLRHGPSDPAQGLLPADADELREQAEALGLKELPIEHPSSDDLLGRDGVRWETLAFER